MSAFAANPASQLPPDAPSADELVITLLNVSQNAINFMRPVYAAGTQEVVDFTIEFLNQAGQRMLGLPERPGVVMGKRFPHTHTLGIFDFYRQVFASGAPGRFDVNYRQDGLDNFFQLSAQRSGNLLVVIFTDTSEHDWRAAEQALRDSQAREQASRAEAEIQRQRLYSVLMQLPANVATNRGPDHVFDLVNPRYQQLFPTRTLKGLPIRQALPELVGQQHLAILDRVYQTGDPYYGHELETWVDFGNTGRLEKCYFNVFFQAIRNTQGQIDGLLNFSFDVTEQVVARQQVQLLNEELEFRVLERTQEVQRAQAEAEWQKQRLERLFMQAPAAICILKSPDLVFELVNPAYQQLFPGRQLLNLPLLQALPELQGHSVSQTFREVYQTGLTHEEQALLIPIFRPADGVLENRYFNFIQQARHNETGDIDGVLVFAFEVTEQVEARKATEASAKQLRLITDALPVLIGYLDREEKYRFANQAYQTWFNQNPKNLLGRPVREVVGEKAYAGVSGYIQRALAGERVDFEARMPYRENFTKHIRTSYVPDFQGNQVQGFYTLVSDITDQVEAQRAVRESEQQAKALARELAGTNEELRLSNQQLTRTNIDLDNFIYTASHDLKAPILNIEGLIEVLLDQLSPESLQSEAVQQITDLIRGSVKRFRRTIDHLTEITKLQKENQAEAYPINLAALIADVQSDLAPAIQAAGARIDVNVSASPTVVFLEKNLRSILYNLLSNAVKYSSPERPPVVQVRSQMTEAYQVISVQDNGLGINPEQKQKVFGMFQRLHNHVEGSGVGLYMVKKIIENADGKIELESKVGEGSVFKVYFRR
jgi:two-component system, sensor histidine kinase